MKKNKENTQETFKQTIATLLFVMQLVSIIFTALPISAQQETKPVQYKKGRQAESARIPAAPCQLAIGAVCNPDPTPTPTPMPAPPQPTPQPPCPLAASLRCGSPEPTPTPEPPPPTPTPGPDPILDSRVFIADWYLDLNPDVAAAYGPGNTAAAISHWTINGINEGRMSSPMFDVKYYLDKNPDLRNAFGNNYRAVINHWLTNGMREGRQASLLFDAQYYLNNNADLKAAFGANSYEAALSHWLNNGIYEGRRASLEFDPKYYLGANPDVAAAYGATNYRAAINHWLVNGRNENRAGAPPLPPRLIQTTVQYYVDELQNGESVGAISDNFTITSQRADTAAEINRVSSLPTNVQAMTNIKDTIQARGNLATASEVKQLYQLMISSAMSVPALPITKWCFMQPRYNFNVFEPNLLGGVNISGTGLGNAPPDSVSIRKNGVEIASITLWWGRRQRSWDLARRYTTYQINGREFVENVTFDRVGDEPYVPLADDSECFGETFAASFNSKLELPTPFIQAPKEQFSAIREHGPSCNDSYSANSILGLPQENCWRDAAQDFGKASGDFYNTCLQYKVAATAKMPVVAARAVGFFLKLMSGPPATEQIPMISDDLVSSIDDISTINTNNTAFRTCQVNALPGYIVSTRDASNKLSSCLERHPEQRRPQTPAPPPPAPPGFTPAPPPAPPQGGIVYLPAPTGGQTGSNCTVYELRTATATANGVQYLSEVEVRCS